MGGINCGWLAVGVPSPDWSYATFVRRLSEAAAPEEGRGVRAKPRLCIEYPGVCLTTEEN